MQECKSRLMSEMEKMEVPTVHELFLQTESINDDQMTTLRNFYRKEKNRKKKPQNYDSLSSVVPMRWAAAAVEKQTRHSFAFHGSRCPRPSCTINPPSTPLLIPQLPTHIIIANPSLSSTLLPIFSPTTTD